MKNDERELNRDDRLDQQKKRSGDLIRQAMKPAILVGRYFDIPSRYGRGQTIENIMVAGFKVTIASMIVFGISAIIYARNYEHPKRECQEILEVNPSPNRGGVIVDYRRVDGEVAKWTLPSTGAVECAGVKLQAGDYLWMPAGPPIKSFGPFTP